MKITTHGVDVALEFPFHGQTKIGDLINIKAEDQHTDASQNKHAIPTVRALFQPATFLDAGVDAVKVWIIGKQSPHPLGGQIND